MSELAIEKKRDIQIDKSQLYFLINLWRINLFFDRIFNLFVTITIVGEKFTLNLSKGTCRIKVANYGTLCMAKIHFFLRE